jgi:hypothetical protein
MEFNSAFKGLIFVQVLLIMVIVINMYIWTLTLRERHRLRAFYNGALRRGKKGRK